MQERVIYIDTIGLQTRRLVTEAGRPVEYAVFYQDADDTGSLYWGRVINVQKHMQAAFVDIGEDKNAYLPLQDVPAQCAPLRNGQEVMVQVVKRAQGEKGARVTMQVVLPGQYIVFVPLSKTAGVSRHIEEERRNAFQAFANALVSEKGQGLIIRTAGEHAQPEEIQNEYAQLLSTYETLVQSANTRKAPALLQEHVSVTEATARDIPGAIVQGPLPDGLETQLQKDLRRKIWLKSGAYLVWDRTEAMTVIDVNSGKYTGKQNAEHSVLALNIEAAKKIAQLLRLRDTGGIIVVDFVDMPSEENRRSVEEAFCAEMKGDRAKYHVHGFSAAGLLELTRRSLHQSIDVQIHQPCTCCDGTGFHETPMAQAHQMLRSIRKRRDSGDESKITLDASPAVQKALLQIGLPQNVQVNNEENEQ